MKSIYIAGGCKGNTAVNILKGHLETLGHHVTRDAKDPLGWDVTLRWGVSYHGNKPAINAGVNAYDKMDSLVRFRACDILGPKVINMAQATDWAYGNQPKFPKLPWLARKRRHVKGKDIRVCKTWDDVTDVLDYDNGNCSHDFFSVFIPTQTEYRVWVLHNHVFGIYEKVFKGEGEYEGFMRNHRFGFKFEKRDNLRGMKEIEVPCAKAVKALDMEFGAVDVLLGKDGKFYVLEVNSMPHIDSPKRSTGIRLANLLSEWAENVN
jgi:hypothetical protein